MDARRTWEGVPVESVSPPQSVPGRRTPLGAVGLGGFYMQGGQPPQPQHCYPTDENQPEPGTSFGQRSVNSYFLRTSKPSVKINFYVLLGVNTYISLNLEFYRGC